MLINFRIYFNFLLFYIYKRYNSGTLVIASKDINLSREMSSVLLSTNKNFDANILKYLFEMHHARKAVFFSGFDLFSER